MNAFAPRGEARHFFSIRATVYDLQIPFIPESPKPGTGFQFMKSGALGRHIQSCLKASCFRHRDLQRVELLFV